MSASRLDDLGTDAALFLYRGGKVYRLTLTAVDDRQLERALAAHFAGAKVEEAAPVSAPAPAPVVASSPTARMIDCPLCWHRAVPSETLEGGRVRCGHCRGAIPAAGGSPMRAVVGRRTPKKAKTPESPRVSPFAGWGDALRSRRRTLGVVGAIALALAVYVLFPFNLLRLQGQPPVYPARGEVVLDGQPLANAAIVLHPVSGGDDAPSPRATADAQGRFELRATPTANGIPAGEYAVTVQCFPPPSGKDDGVVPRNFLPERYSNPQTSGLTLRIEAGENQLPILRLKK